MATKHFCDRCKKEANEAHVQTVRLLPVDQTWEMTYFLCNPCMKEITTALKSFMIGRKLECK